MATPLNSWSKEEVRAVIRFLNAKKVAPGEIHDQLREVYGDNVISKSRVYEWCKFFNQGRLSIGDDARIGRPRTSTTDENIQKVDDMIRQDRRLKIRYIASELDISKSTVYEIVHNLLGYHKVCARWVPKQLTDDHKQTRMGLSLAHLSGYKLEGNEFLERIVTGDETWVHYATPENKRDSLNDLEAFGFSSCTEIQIGSISKKTYGNSILGLSGNITGGFFTIGRFGYCRTLPRNA